MRHRLPHPDLPGPAGPDLVQAGRATSNAAPTTSTTTATSRSPRSEAANGYETDFHEFLITPWNTALILADDPATANLTSIGGPADQAVVDGVVQEIDIKTGRVLFQWNSADHVPYSRQPLPSPPPRHQPWDWFHINAVHLDTDGNLLIDARNTWTTYKVNLRTGQIMWSWAASRVPSD